MCWPKNSKTKILCKMKKEIPWGMAQSGLEKIDRVLWLILEETWKIKLRKWGSYVETSCRQSKIRSGDLKINLGNRDKNQRLTTLHSIGKTQTKNSRACKSEGKNCGKEKEIKSWISDELKMKRCSRYEGYCSIQRCKKEEWKNRKWIQGKRIWAKGYYWF